MKWILYITLFLGLWIFLSQCVIFKFRWSDTKANKVFKAKKVPVQLYDTIINDRHIHYAITGSEALPTLVFIHGSPGSWMNYAEYMWDSAMLSKFRMVSIDRPGFGYSNFGEAMHLQDQCILLLPVLEKLKTDAPMYLCGHSMGGPIVVQLAASAPSLFNKILIVAGSIDVTQEKKESWRKIIALPTLYWLLPGAFAPSNDELLYLKKDLIPLQAEFKKVTCDVQFIHGDKDTWVPIENIAYGKKMLINAQSITSDTLQGADHLFPWKRTSEFKNLLLRL